MKLRRSEFLKIGSLLAVGISGELWAGETETGRKGKLQKTPVIHTTDLYHFHCDPDDHWDLATVYALAYSGNIDLKGVLIDYPAIAKTGVNMPELDDPDVMGVAQMNYITGLVVPVAIGSPLSMTSRKDTQPQASKQEHQGVNWLLETLRKSETPVVINIVGAATNVAVALNKDPELFKKKCRAIYLNAGAANSIKDRKLEYNVRLNPLAFAAIFDAPCPVYWMPCATRTNVWKVEEYGSYYGFTQKDILPFLSKRLQNFFMFMFTKKESHRWFSYLNGEPETSLLRKFGEEKRNMWCTAGFIHAAGKNISPDGRLIPSRSKMLSVSSFLPIDAKCDDQGYVDWKRAKLLGNRFIFHVNDTSSYQKAVTLAMKDLLLQLPK